MARRLRKIALNDDWKARIRAGVIMDRLIKHVNGQISMEPTQVTAANILLRKIVPDLSATAVTGDLNVNVQLADRLSNARKRA